MLIKTKKSYEIKESEVTPQHQYLNRRSFMRGAVGLAGTLALAACRPARPDQQSAAAPTAAAGADQSVSAAGEGEVLAESARVMTDEIGAAVTPLEDITGFNNFYEFTTDKRDVAKLAKDYVTTPWQIEIGGHVNNPGVYDVADILKNFDQEERIYRMRCVEGWSMVIPWNGFSLNKLLKEVEPTAKGKYVAFETILDPDNMPGQSSIFGGYDWPYKEGLRIDEAMNDLTMVSTGIYGDPLLPQNGAPIRIVVPWKYGFKSIKSIVKITLVEEEPPILWKTANAREYGFFSNVNPTVDHPRWSQATERRIGESGRRETLMFNGYEEQVAAMYANMDLSVDF